MLYNSFCVFYLKNIIIFLIYFSFFSSCAYLFSGPRLFMRLAPRPQARPMRLECA
ncbi:hypothetical protein HanRHA438_Chr01g0039211 [Helianthus annuus]|nr:hypothetical protein HanRHA438_Chr01g0039211 [Helianthus annuus]